MDCCARTKIHRIQLFYVVHSITYLLMNMLIKSFAYGRTRRKPAETLNSERPRKSTNSHDAGRHNRQYNGADYNRPVFNTNHDIVSNWTPPSVPQNPGFNVSLVWLVLCGM